VSGVLHELGPEAFAFILEECSYGGPLARSVAVLPRMGEVMAILPERTPPSDLADFGSGDVADGDEVDELAEIIRDLVAGAPDRICVFEDPTRRKDDPKGLGIPVFTVADRVYPFISNDSGHQQVVEAARAAHWYPSIGVISTVEAGQFPKPASEQPERLLKHLADSAEVVIVGAYDMESWIAWRRSSGDAST
jgi:hypothetical protein